MAAASADSITIDTIREKVHAGERLSFDEGVFLYDEADLFDVGELADAVRRRKNGDVAFYNVNTHLNPTNVCVYRCKFCAFRADLRDPKAYIMSEEQVLERAAAAHARGVTEMHIVGGLHHKGKYDWYKRVLQVIHENFPEIHLKAYTPVEWQWFARISGKPVKEVLREFRDEAGLGSLPGGGAEIFDPEVRSQICEHKADAAAWLDTHRAAHELGIHTNATMLYGHVEAARHRIDHLIRLRELQDQTGGFQTFIPLAFHPENTQLDHIPKPGGLVDLRNIAVSRLMLDNFPHVKAYWIMLGVGIAQLALHYGADDLDGTVVHELIYHDAGASTPEAMTVSQLRRLIAEAGREPVERDTLYHRVHRDGSAWTRGDRLTVSA